MHNFAVARPQFDGLHPMTFRKIGWNREVDVFIGRRALNDMIPANVKNDVGLADVPAIDIRRRCRRVARISFFGGPPDRPIP